MASPGSKRDYPRVQLEDIETSRKRAIKFQAVPTVTLFIGGAKIPFQVQVDLLCEASPVFKVAFNGNFLESCERSMNLPEEAPEVFEQLCNWIYLGNYFNPKFTNTPEDQTIYMFLVKMYVAADKYGILSLENQIMDEWHQVHHLSRKAQPSNSEVIDYAYKTTAPMSNLRKIIVAHYAWEVKHDWYCEDEDENVTALSERPQFIKELVVKMSCKMSGSHKNPFRTLKSSFQEHGERKDDVPETLGDQVSPETSEDEWTQMDTSRLEMLATEEIAGLPIATSEYLVLIAQMLSSRGL